MIGIAQTSPMEKNASLVPSRVPTRAPAGCKSILIVMLYLKGSARLLTDLLRYGAQDKYRVTVLLLTGEVVSSAEVPDGIAIMAGDYFSTPLRKLAGVFAIARLSRRHDIVVSNAELTPTYMTAAGAWMACKRAVGVVHVHLSAIFHYRQRPSVHRQVMSLFYPTLKKVIACSDGVAEDLRSQFRLRRVVSVPNSVDLDRIESMASEALPPGLAGLFSQPVVLTIGVLAFQKGADVLLQAFARVVGSGLPHHLVIVGDGDERENLKRLIGQLNLAGRVHLIGYVKNPYPLLKRAEVFALSSRFEGFPLVIMEAMALGVPVVSTDCNGGPRDVLAQGPCGVLVPVDDPEQLALAVMKVLTDSDLARELRAAGLREVKERDVKLWGGRFLEAIVS